MATSCSCNHDSRGICAGDEGRIVVVGPSGCGKSFLVRAGLLPAIAKESGWATLIPFVTGTDLVVVLSHELANAACSAPSQIQQQLDDNGLVLAIEKLLRTLLATASVQGDPDSVAFSAAYHYATVGTGEGTLRG